MPDPLLYLQTTATAAGTSAIVVLVLGRLHRPVSAGRLNATALCAVATGLIAGGLMLRLHPVWPPTNALGRFMAIVLPAVFLLELLAGFGRSPVRLSWLLRLLLAFAVLPVLLYGSVYLDASRGEWSRPQAAVVLTTGGGFLATVWVLLVRLAHRAADGSVALGLALAIQSAGIAVMLAGYIGGGEAAIPPAAAIAGCVLASMLLPTRPSATGVIGVGIVTLFSLLVIGRFFGALTTARAVALLLAPLLAWLPDLLRLRAPPRLVTMLRMACVAVGLGLVLLDAQREFDREMRPLLGTADGWHWRHCLPEMARSCYSAEVASREPMQPMLEKW